MSTDAKVQANTKQGETSVASYTEAVDTSGKKVWVVTLGKSKYRVPDAYVVTRDYPGPKLSIHWPSKLPMKNAQKTGNADEIVIYLDLTSSAPIRGFDKEVMARIGHTTRVSIQFPELLEIMDSKGQSTGDFVTNRDDVKGLDGEPFKIRGSRVTSNCRTYINLPESGRIVVDFHVQHLADWHQIFLEVLRLINSMKEQ